LFIFGKVLPEIGIADPTLTIILLPGVVALTVFLTAWQSMTVGLSVDLGFLHEIDDRLLAPIPVSLVALEKVLFAALRALVAGAIIFPLAFFILGSGYQVRTDLLWVTVGLMALIALMASALGLHYRAIDFYWLHLLSVALARHDQMVSGAYAAEPINLRV
jgi:ABC-2 type transport system permease protein